MTFITAAQFCRDAHGVQRGTNSSMCYAMYDARRRLIPAHDMPLAEHGFAVRAQSCM